MDKNKKVLIIGGSIEGAILLFALVLSIIVWSTISKGEFATKADFYKANLEHNGPFIAFFQNNTVAFFCIICIPVFIMVALDFIYFAIIASKRESSLSDDQLKAIKAQAEKEVREEMMKEVLEEEKKE